MRGLPILLIAGLSALLAEALREPRLQIATVVLLVLVCVLNREKLLKIVRKIAWGFSLNLPGGSLSGIERDPVLERLESELLAVGDKTEVERLRDLYKRRITRDIKIAALLGFAVGRHSQLNSFRNLAKSSDGRVLYMSKGKPAPDLGPLITQQLSQPDVRLKDVRFHIGIDPSGGVASIRIKVDEDEQQRTYQAIFGSRMQVAVVQELDELERIIQGAEGGPFD